MRAYNYKSVTADVKDIDTKRRIVTGYASAFNNRDTQGEIVRPGAFTKTVAEWGPEGKNRIAHLYQHNAMSVLGKPTKLIEDETGLYFESKIANTTFGKDVLILYDEGIINEHSIGYEVVKHIWDEETQTRDLIEMKLYEYSSVTWGANEETPFTGFASFNPMKSEHYDKVSEQITALQKALKRELSDETAIALEISLKQLQQAFINIGESLREPPKPDTSKTKPPATDTQLVEIFTLVKDHNLFKGR